MNRRVFLGTVTGTVPFIGCLSSSDGISNEAHAESISNTLEEESMVIVENWALNNEKFHIYYRFPGSRELGLRLVAGAYAGAVADGFEPPMVGNEYDATGEPVLYYEIEPKWAQDFMDDTISENEYIGMVMEDAQTWG